MKNWFAKIRSTVYEKYGIWDVWDLLPYRWSMYYYDVIKPIFFPKHQKIRKAIPRAWVDSVSLIVDINFAIIKEFYEDEYMLGFVDWEGSSDKHAEFEQWLKQAYTYICYKRPSLQAEMDNSYPSSKPLEEWFEKIERDGKTFYQMKDDGIPYEVKYKDVIRLEKEITETDTKFLKEMVEYRAFFWT